VEEALNLPLGCPACRATFRWDETLPERGSPAGEEELLSAEALPAPARGPEEEPPGVPDPAPAIGVKWRRHIVGEERRKTRRFHRLFLAGTAVPLLFAVAEFSTRRGRFASTDCGVIIAAPFCGLLFALLSSVALNILPSSSYLVRRWSRGRTPDLDSLDPDLRRTTYGILTGKPRPRRVDGTPSATRPPDNSPLVTDDSLPDAGTDKPDERIQE
jgi:hypothetical protein